MNTVYYSSVMIALRPTTAFADPKETEALDKKREEARKWMADKGIRDLGRTLQERVA